jgi:hypothetical protein
MKSSTFLDVAGNVWHPQLGTQGIRVVGRQPQCIVNFVSGTDDCFTPAVNTNMDLLTTNHFELNPMDMGSLLRQYGSMYSRYCIRKMDFVYTSSLGTNTTNSTLAMGIKQDPGISSGFSGPPLTFSDVRTCQDSCTFNTWTPKCVLSYVYKGFDTWYTGYGADQAGIGDAEQFDLWLRSTSQALFAMFPNFTIATSNLPVGLLDVLYEVEFFFPVLQGLLGGALSKDERELIQRLRKEEKTEKRPQSIEDLRRAKIARSDQKDRKLLSRVLEEEGIEGFETLGLPRDGPRKEKAEDYCLAPTPRVDPPVSVARKLLAVLRES